MRIAVADRVYTPVNHSTSQRKESLVDL